jgi:exopolysaccharide biosynthesis polyprenyl glycosylphosphotransferase
LTTQLQTDVQARAATADATTLAGGRRRLGMGRARRGQERVLVLGSGVVARRVIGLARSGVRGPAHVVGCLDDDPAPPGEDAPPVIGRIDDLDRVLVEERVERVVVSFPHRSDSEILPLLRRCEAAGVAIDVVPRFFEVLNHGGRVRALGGLPLLAIGRRQLRPWQPLVKRSLDIVGSLVILAVFLPFLLAVAAAIVLDDRGPVFYRSTRLGRDGVLFKMWKFRSMVPDADMDQIARTQALLSGQLKPTQDPRVTRVGRFLRCQSLDELPQLINVLVGQMSLVGPRPIVAAEAETLQAWQRVRHEVRPGITGPWQVSGRSGLPWDERMQLDCSYARYWTIASDLRILMRTVPAVVTRRGAF